MWKQRNKQRISAENRDNELCKVSPKFSFMLYIRHNTTFQAFFFPFKAQSFSSWHGVAFIGSITTQSLTFGYKAYNYLFNHPVSSNRVLPEKPPEVTQHTSCPYIHVHSHHVHYVLQVFCSYKISTTWSITC